jgi:GDP-L-fucose synthase
MVGKNLDNHLRSLKSYIYFTPSKAELNLLNQNEIGDYIEKNQIDTIVHCAAKVGGIKLNSQQPYTFLNENTLMGLNLLNVAVKFGIKKFINISSANIYPVSNVSPLTEKTIGTGPLEEETKGYSLAKLVLCEACQLISKEYNLHYKTIIPSNLYGPYDRFNKTTGHLVPSAIIKVSESKSTKLPIEIWGDGTARRELLYVEDLVDFIIFALHNYDQLKSNTNIGTGIDHSVKEIYQYIKNIIRSKQPFNYDHAMPSGNKKKLLSIKELNLTGWYPKHSLNQGLIKTINFYNDKYVL